MHSKITITEKIRYILQFILSFAIGAYLLLLFFLNNSFTQQQLTRCVADLMSDKIGTEVSIRSIEVGLFNRVILNQVQVKDLKGKTLLKADRATAKIALRSLLTDQLSLRTISLLDTDVRIYKETPQGPTNLQFIIDAFANPEKKSKSKVNLRINSLILRRINISYDELYRPQTPNRFNTGHLQLNQLTTNISVKHLTPDSVKFYVRAISFNEASGFTLEKAHGAFAANRNRAVIQKLDVTLPHSHIRQEKLVATYDGSKDIGHLLKTLNFKGKIDHTQLSTQDFRMFHPLLDHLDLQTSFTADFHISPQRIVLKQLTLDEAQHQLQIHTRATVEREQGRIAAVKAQIEGIHIENRLAGQLASFFKVRPAELQMLTQSGNLDLQGEGEYDIRTAEGKGKLHLQTSIGQATVSTNWKEDRLSNDFTITGLAIDQLMSRPDLPTQIDLKGQADLIFRQKQIASVQGKAQIGHLLWNGYAYQQLQLQAGYARQQLKAELSSSDPQVNLNLQAQATLPDGKLQTATAEVLVHQIFPEKLGFQTPYQAAGFKGKVKAEIRQAYGRYSGTLALDDFSMTGSPRGDYQLKHLEASLQSTPQNECLQIRSDFLNARLESDRPLKHIVQDLQPLLRRSLPGLLPEQEKAEKPVHSLWSIQAQVRKNEVFDKMLRIPFNFKEDLNIRGTIDTGPGKSSLYVFTDGFHIGRQVFNESSLFLQGKASEYQCLIKSKTFLSNKNFECIAKLQTHDSLLISQINWHANTEKNYDGAIHCTTQFSREPQPAYRISILPTQFCLADTVWQIAPGEIESHDQTLAIKHFKVSHADQALTINGSLSPHRNDSIQAQLNRIDIEYILGLVNFHAVDFGGKASGRIVLNHTIDNPVVQADLHIPHFTFNHGLMGQTHLTGNWNKEENRIQLEAQMNLPQGQGAGTHVKGFVSLAEKGLSLHIDAQKTNLRFLRRYMDGIFDQFDGEATGHVHLYGPFKQLDFKGDLTAQAEARIMATGVKYKVSQGHVVLSPGKFAFQNFTVQDYRKGTGQANGYLKHNHLKDLTYKFDIKARHLLCYDMPQTPDMPFYSTTTGSGEVQLEGFPGNFMANISLRPESPTQLVYNLGTADAISANDQMIRFHALQPDRPQWTIPDSLLRHSVAPQRATDDEEEESTTNIILNFLIDTNPSAELKIIMDPRAGDAITAYGSGPIRARFYNKGNFEMYGTYHLDRGTYKLSLQDVIRKDLKMKQGSKIVFSGDPMQADLGLNAVYSLNGVSLSDLNFSAGFSEKSVNVDCLLNIRGKASAPQVNFDLDLHNISEDEKQMVRQLIATEEDMNRQVIYLLGIGRFYATNPQISSGQNSAQDPGAAAMKSFLSTTLTSQLNSAISSALGSQSHWSFGTNVAPGVLGWEDVEVDGLLQGRLFNDRLLINGNFGYRDRPTYTSNFVGDFNVKYLLTPKGTISLKAYSETTDRYFTKSSLTTQGIGISLQRDFTHFKDLFRIKKRKKKLKEKE